MIARAARTGRLVAMAAVAALFVLRVLAACSSSDDTAAPALVDGGGHDATTPSGLDAAPGNDATTSDGSSAADAADASAVALDGAPATVLVLYPDVPGLAPSDHYAFRVRPADPTLSPDAGWEPTFAWVTASPSGGDAGYFANLGGWSNTYMNVEANGAIEVEISRTDGSAITSAAVHPTGKGGSTIVVGRAYVVLPAPSQVAVDIDGQMDNQDTGYGYTGPPIHTVTLNSNPVLAGAPDAGDPSVYVVQPGDTPPSTGDWTTLAFASGVHDVGLGFPLHAGKSYYIPGDAIVYGSLTQEDGSDGHDITVYGYGTLSGARLTHPSYVTPVPTDTTPYQSISIEGSYGTSVTGLSFADPAFHTLQLYGAYHEGAPAIASWVKIMGWRKNGDGVNPFGNVLFTDSFVRTQDDASYANGLGIQRVVYWNDANGSDFVLSALPNAGAAAPLVIEDCDVIYARAAYDNWSGGRLFNMRGLGSGPAGANVIFRNIRVEDPRPTLQSFLVAMEGVEPWLQVDASRGPGDLAGILFQNITIAAGPTRPNQPDVLWGAPDASIHDLTFDNVTIGGVKIDAISHFKTNAYVSNLVFP